MLRSIIPRIGCVLQRACAEQTYLIKTSSSVVKAATFSPNLIINRNIFNGFYYNGSILNQCTQRLLAPPKPACDDGSVRTLTKFSLGKGKRKSVKAVLKRFYRLDWGIWIRGKCGRAKKLFRKSANRKRRLRQHVFTNATQSYLLDKMVTKYWRKRKYYIDDPYEPYHKRENFFITRKKPVIPQT